MKGPRAATVTERSFYSELLRIIAEKGGSGVQEISYNSEPDIVFDFLGTRWILSVKIGETPSIIKGAFLQYHRHKFESGIKNGLLLMIPESFRRITPSNEEIAKAINQKKVSVLIDAGPVQEEYRDYSFPEILGRIKDELAPLIQQGIQKHYPLSLVMSLLKTQVLELMNTLTARGETILNIVTDEELLKTLGRISTQEADDAARFLGAYILLSQILFLRLFAAVCPDVVSGTGQINRIRLRQSFRKILDINYRRIYEIDVLDVIPDEYIRDTFDLIWGLEIERVKYELPGRIFHELMPKKMRKILAAFYTRPQAAEILSRLTISRNDTVVFDPASGSGTILVAACRRKKTLHETEGRRGNPHKRFCEEELFGADIMPFAAHLATANLASMDVSETIAGTQIIQGDSLNLAMGRRYPLILQVPMFITPPMAQTLSGEEYETSLDKVDTILMNPPFTKIERGVRKYVNLERFKGVTGGEVGLWGHFLFLAYEFLRDDGMCGAVIPINVLRGRESEKVRRALFEKWTPLYVLKPTLNYGFSEWAEYRDILFIAKKTKAHDNHRVKFCLLKKDLRDLDEGDFDRICGDVKMRDSLRSDAVDIDSHELKNVLPRLSNLMWFCGGIDLKSRDLFMYFLSKYDNLLDPLTKESLREGYRCEGGNAKFLFFTRRVGYARSDEAFLHFDRESGQAIEATTSLGTVFGIDLKHLRPSLRTPVSLCTLDITKQWDYIAQEPYPELRRVQRACGFNIRRQKLNFWETHRRAVKRTECRLVTVLRLNPFSPNTHAVAFFSDKPICPSDQFKAVLTRDAETAKALCVLFNSCLFFVQFFLLKEESTGRFLHVRTEDLIQMKLWPKPQLARKLAKIFQKYRTKKFPSLSEQFDLKFEEHYEKFWSMGPKDQSPAKWSMVFGSQVEPSPIRLQFDSDVCHALKVSVSETDLRKIYCSFVKEMIVARGLAKD